MIISRGLKVAAILAVVIVNQIFAGFDPCRFNFGMAWKGDSYNYPSELDYVTIWAGSDEEFNQYWHGSMLRACLPGGRLDGKTPVYYSYIIAFTARRDWGLLDCDVGSPSLCERGAEYIRTRWSRITGQYEKYASETARIYGNRQIIWLMEPDYYQYSYSSQQGGSLSFSELGQKMSELVGIIKRHLPNAIISMDISPWNTNQSGWYGSFNMSQFSYVNTSGGRTEANSSRIRNSDPATWSGIYNLTRKGIIADDGYGWGGGNIGHDATWDDPNNINARIADGVIAITQADPRSDWNGIIANLRPRLNTPLTCGGGGGGGGTEPSTYTLSVSVSGSGSVAKSPNQATYSSGTSVMLTATAASGYTFSGWGGDLSGTQNPVTVTMNSNKTITATFTATGGGGGGTTPGTELLTNGNFSSGTTGWYLGAYNGAQATGSVTSGEYVTTISNGGTAVWNVQMTQGNLRLEAGKTYTLSFRARASANRTVQANVGMSASPYSSYLGAFNVNLTTTMQTFTKTFTMTTTDASAMSNVRWYLDDVSIVEGSSTTPPPSEYSLNITTSGSGTVAKSPNQTSYTSGTQVTLTATPSAGYQFSGWSGSISGTTNPATITMDANKSVTATFTQIQNTNYTLSVTINGSGTVTKSPDQTSYLSGSQVTLTATPASGYVFSGWGGELSGTANPATITMNANKAVTATFTASGGTPPGEGSGLTGEYYDNMDFTNLKVTRIDETINFNWGNRAPDPSMGADQFSVRWTGQVQPAYTETYTFYANTDDGVRLWVNGQKIIEYWVDKSATESRGTISLQGGQKYDIKMEYFDNKRSAVAQLSWSSARQAKQIIPKAALYPSSATPPPPSEYALAITISGSGTVTKSPNKTSYASGEAVVLTATAASGYVFSGWSGAISGTANPITITMNSNKSVTATFSSQSGGGGSPVNIVKNGDFSGGTTSWNLGAYNGANAWAQVVNGEYVVSTSTQGSASWNIQLTQTGIKLEQGKTYTLSFDARASSNRGIEVNIGMSNSPYSSYSGATTVNVTTTTQRFTKTFTMSGTTDLNARVEFNAGLASPTWYLDNVVLIEVSGLPKRTAIINTSLERGSVGVRQAQGGLMLSMRESGKIRVSLYDIRGRVVKTLHDGVLFNGIHIIPMQGVIAGTYIVSVRDQSTEILRERISFTGNR